MQGGDAGLGLAIFAGFLFVVLGLFFGQCLVLGGFFDFHAAAGFGNFRLLLFLFRFFDAKLLGKGFLTGFLVLFGFGFAGGDEFGNAACILLGLAFFFGEGGSGGRLGAISFCKRLGHGGTGLGFGLAHVGGGLCGGRRNNDRCDHRSSHDGWSGSGLNFGAGFLGLLFFLEAFSFEFGLLPGLTFLFVGFGCCCFLFLLETLGIEFGLLFGLEPGFLGFLGGETLRFFHLLGLDQRLRFGLGFGFGLGAFSGFLLGLGRSFDFLFGQGTCGGSVRGRGGGRDRRSGSHGGGGFDSGGGFFLAAGFGGAQDFFFDAFDFLPADFLLTGLFLLLFHEINQRLVTALDRRGRRLGLERGQGGQQEAKEQELLQMMHRC